MKRLAILAIIAMFVIAGTAFAAEQMTNDELAGIKAGDWAVKNKLKLDLTSQQNVQAISNANVVDSGVAVQSNIDSLSKTATEVLNTNEAEVAMSRAASDISIIGEEHSTISSSTTTDTTIEESSSSTESTSRGLLGIFAENTPGDTSSDSSLIINGETTADAQLDGSLTIKTRCSKDTKNTLYLTDSAQMLTQAISNLNAVASGVAIQSNIVSGIEMSGTLTNSNIANVQSGL